MSFTITMQRDIEAVYAAKELSVDASYMGNSISVMFVNDMDVASLNQRIISALSSQVFGISPGDIMTIDGIDYEVVNHDYKDAYHLEMLIALERV